MEDQTETCFWVGAERCCPCRKDGALLSNNAHYQNQVSWRGLLLTMQSPDLWANCTEKRTTHTSPLTNLCSAQGMAPSTVLISEVGRQSMVHHQFRQQRCKRLMPVIIGRLLAAHVIPFQSSPFLSCTKEAILWRKYHMYCRYTCTIEDQDRRTSRSRRKCPFLVCQQTPIRSWTDDEALLTSKRDGSKL